MKQKEITITVSRDGEEREVAVTLGYCYATEIAYTDLSGGDISDYIRTLAGTADGGQRMPDAKSTICLILAAALAYSQSRGEEPPVTDADLMYGMSPADLAAALGTVIALRAEFYHVPEPAQPKERQKGKKGKNSPAPTTSTSSS